MFLGTRGGCQANSHAKYGASTREAEQSQGNEGHTHGIIPVLLCDAFGPFGLVRRPFGPDFSARLAHSLSRRQRLRRTR